MTGTTNFLQCAVQYNTGKEGHICTYKFIPESWFWVNTCVIIFIHRHEQIPAKKTEGRRPLQVADDEKRRIWGCLSSIRPPSCFFFWYACDVVSSLLCTPTISAHSMSLYERYSTHTYIVVLKKLEKRIGYLYMHLYIVRVRCTMYKVLRAG